ncbi:MAG: HEAT repeat domain-containing protein [Thermoanaerobaculia bacterium]
MADGLLERARSTDAEVRQRVAHQVADRMDPGDLSLMVEMLGDRDWRVRKTIVEGFLRKPSEEIVRALIESLRDPENAGKRNSATEALIRIGEPATPNLLAALRREIDPDVRLSLVNLLGDIRTDDAFRALVQMLPEEKDLNILSSVVSSLGKYQRAAAVAPLLRTLVREDVWLRFHVIEALGEIGDRSALPAILPMYAEKALRKPVLEAVGKIGDVGTVNFLLKVIGEDEKLNLTALRALIRLAEADKPRVIEGVERQMIQRRFRESFPASKIPPLIEHLRSTPKRDVKNFILKFLGWSSDPRVIDPLLESIEQPESGETAAQALVDYGPAAAAAVLEKLRTTEDMETLALLIRVAHAIGGSEAVPRIIAFLDHDSTLLRRLAIESLGQTPDPSGIDYLLAKLDDPDVGCQQAAVEAITGLVASFPAVKGETIAKLKKLIGSRSVPEKLNALSILVKVQGEGYPDELLLASKDGDALIRQKAIALMGTYGEARFADQLVLALADESKRVRVAAIEALVKIRPERGLGPLMSALEDGDVWIRTAAAQALGEYRTPAAIDALMRHLDTDQPPVRIAIIEALGKSGRPEILPALTSSLESPDIEIRKAVLLAMASVPGDEVFDRVLSFLASPDWRLRGAAATALGQRGEPRALDHLHAALLAERDPFVEQALVLALDRLGRRESFPILMRVLDRRAILDEISDMLVRHKETYRDLLEEAWRTADSRQEVVMSAILRAMKEAPGAGATERK